ncbi:MAG: hypothetical protein ACI9W2_003762 [Gammaproteobacteria bacterium]|jgi:hypothetical protein
MYRRRLGRVVPAKPLDIHMYSGVCSFAYVACNQVCLSGLYLERPVPAIWIVYLEFRLPRIVGD